MASPLWDENISATPSAHTPACISNAAQLHAEADFCSRPAGVVTNAPPGRVLRPQMRSARSGRTRRPKDETEEQARGARRAPATRSVSSSLALAQERAVDEHGRPTFPVLHQTDQDGNSI